MDDRFSLSNYIFCKYAGAVGVLNSDGELLFYAEREGMSKIGKDAYVYTNKYKSNRVLVIRAPNAIKELNPTFTDRTYVVEDFRTNEIVGEIGQRKFVRLFNDVWTLSLDGEMVGKVRETDLFRHLFHGLVIPRRYYIESADGSKIGVIEELRSLANLKFVMEIERHAIDGRLLVAMGILLAMLKINL